MAKLPSSIIFSASIARTGRVMYRLCDASDARAALCAPNARKSGLKPSTAEELFYGTNHNRTQRTRARLEAFFITADVTIEVLLKQPIELRLLGMPRPVLGRRFGNQGAAGILRRNACIQ
jgi:hypothetical protein